MHTTRVQAVLQYGAQFKDLKNLVCLSKFEKKGRTISDKGMKKLDGMADGN